MTSFKPFCLSVAGQTSATSVKRSKSVGSPLLAHVDRRQKYVRNVYAHTRKECEEKLKTLNVEIKAELAKLKTQKTQGEALH